MKYNFIKIINIILLAMLVLGCQKKNHSPYAPYTPIGPSIGSLNVNYSFSSLAIDPDDDSVSISFDWGEDDTSFSFISPWVASGESVSMSHSWKSIGTYHVKAQAQNVYWGSESKWSLPHYIKITSTSFDSIVWICQTASAGWSPRESHTTLVFNNKMCVLGGAGERLRPCHDVWNSPDGFHWTYIVDSAQFLGDDSRVVVFDNKIWAIGGTEGGNYRNDIWCSGDGVNWTCVTDSAQWSPRTNHSIVVFDNKIWVIGGITYNYQLLTDVWYSTDGINWVCATKAEAGLGHRIEPAVVVFDNKIWIMGGEPGRNDVWYTSNGKKWYKATDSTAWSRRYYHTAVVFDNKMWVLGGRGVGEMNDVWYSTDGVNWIQEIPLTIFPKRSDHSAVVFNDMIWVMGGFYFSDVWYRAVIGGK